MQDIVLSLILGRIDLKGLRLLGYHVIPPYPPLVKGGMGDLLHARVQAMQIYLVQLNMIPMI